MKIIPKAFPKKRKPMRTSRTVSVPARLLPLLLPALLLTAACTKEPEETPSPSEEVTLGLIASEIPYVKINTFDQTIVNEPKVRAELSVYENLEETTRTWIGIEYRGSTSYRLFEKKSYGWESRDEEDQDAELSFLGFPEEEDWVLYGPYSDKTLLRNLLIYELSHQIGRYTARSKFVELEINGRYEGLYVMMEKIKRDKNRVDLSKLKSGDIEPGEISGGYLLKIDKTAGDTQTDHWEDDAAYTESLGFRSNYDVDGKLLENQPYGPKLGSETYFLYEYPKAEAIVQAQKDYIKQYIDAFEKALLEDDFEQSERTYTAYIEPDSFVDFFLLNEISANPDAYRLSTFLYKDKDSKLNMGPIWDFNIAFGNDIRSQAHGWIYLYNQNYPNDTWLVPFWWKRLMEDPVFRSTLKSRWNELKGTYLNTGYIHSRIDFYVDYLRANKAISRNYKRWPVLGTELPFNSFVGATYEDEINYLKNWIADRVSWMDGQIRQMD